MLLPLAVLLLACDPFIPSVGDVLPANGATGVPANAAIVFETNVREDVSAMVVVTSGMGGSSGAAALGPGDVFVFDPAGSLAPGNWNATISLDGPGGSSAKTVGFTVAVTSTDGAAPVPSADEMTFDTGSYFDVGPSGDCPDPPGVWAVTSDWGDATDASAVAYAVRGLLRQTSDVTIGALAGETLSLQVFAYDEAGNSAAYPAGEFETPGVPSGDDGGGCGCRVGGTGKGVRASMLVALAALVVVRRRR